MLTDIKDVHGENEHENTEGQPITVEKEENTVLKKPEDRCESRSRQRNSRNMKYSMSMGARPGSFFERMVELIFKHGIFKSIGVFLLIMACVMAWQFINALNYDKVAERVVSELVEKQAQEKIVAQDTHRAGSALRLENNGKIQKALTHLLYDINADRVSILEMHNGKENPSELPFVYCDMTYEETKDQTPFISDEYEQLNMGKYPFFTRLIAERVIMCKVDDLLGYDKKFYSKVLANDTKYVAMIVIKNDLDVGFLVVSFMNEPAIDEHTLLVKLNDCAQQLAALLNLSQEEKPQP